MEINVLDSPAEAGRAVAQRIAVIIRENPTAVIALPTGRTPTLAYEELARLSHLGLVDFSHVTFLRLYAFVGLGPAHPGSFRAYLARHLFSTTAFDRSRLHFIDGDAADLDEECRRYERAVAGAGGIDLLMLGIGANGHIGFNEPGDTLCARTHRVALHEGTRRDSVEPFGGDVDLVPREALTMGMATLRKAARIVLLATGKDKAACIERTIRGPLTTPVPASLLQTHRAVDVYLDRETASLLRAVRNDVGGVG